MSNFFKELKRREVFKTGGLYIGIAWVLIEASSVILPTFDVPDWVFKTIVIIAFIGFPVALILAWFYDVTEEGVHREDEGDAPAGTVVSSRLTNFIIIGILAVALSMSLYFNFTGRPGEVVELEPVSVLIADFDNQTGDAMFNGLLEQALTIGIEAAPNVTAYKRESAQELAKKTNADESISLAAPTAKLIAVREGIQMVLAGSIKSAGGGYELMMTGYDSFNDEQTFDVSISAKSRNDVLTAVGTLSEEVREALGDESFKDKDDATVETFTAASFEAARDYVTALDLSYKGNHEQAAALFKSATEKDPEFGRAYSGWALSAYKLGNKDEADELWKKALTLMNTMTDRERLRTLGLYYAVVASNYAKAKETFAELVEKYPSDAAARNNLQVVAAYSLDFKTAYEQGTVLLELYPNSALYRSNYALLATYAGDFVHADEVAKKLVADDPDYAVSYLAIATAAMSREDYAAARDAYTRMLSATKSEYDSAMGTFGLADVELYLGNYTRARELVAPGIEEDFASGNKATGASKLLLVAESYVGAGNNEAAMDAAQRLASNATSLSHKVVAARVALAAGESGLAEEISAALGKVLQPQSRSYGMMIEGMMLREKGEFVAAIDRFNAAIDMSDLWLIRYERGRAYLDGGFFAEAIDEFRICGTDRVGEATAVFLDEVPTYRYLAELPYWQGRAEEALGMTDAARENYIKYVATNRDDGHYVDDARARVGSLQ
jgi:tetratricopeptide (TPR) repeat protein